jgi:formate dehydrogenase major subunit
VWMCAIAKYIIDSGLAKMDFVNKWVNGFEEYKKSLESFTLEYAEQITGVPAATLTTVAHEIAAADGVCILFAMGVTQHCGGSDTATALSNLLLVTGNYMRPGAGAYPLRGHNNVQGASDFGSMPNVFSGYQKVDDPDIRAKFEADWGVTLPTTKGLDNHEMIRAIQDGTLKSLYIKGEDTITSDANAGDVGDALSVCEFLIVQDINFSETCRYADLVLPAATSLEKEGTFTSTERRIQRIYKAMEPLGESKPDWEIIQLIANRMGGNWNYEHPSDIMDEVARLTPLFAGVSYERLEGFKSQQWPVHADGTDSPLLFTEKFPFPDGKAKFYPIEYIPPSEEISEEFDLHLNNGRLLEHFQQGSMTDRTAGVKAMSPTTFLEISPELAAERGITTGRQVKLISPYGIVRVNVVVTDRVQGKQLYMPINSVEEPVNRLTSSHTDRNTHTPAYKETSVQMTLLPERGKDDKNPIPRGNFRNGHRTPQTGLEIERKWARSDYHLPGTAEADKLVQITSTTV